MTQYYLRRIGQMLLVVLLSAVASYALLNLAPGGPLTGSENCMQGQRGCPTPDALERIRAYFELDLDLPVRFSRWLTGHPRGPVAFSGQSYFGDWIVGCAKPVEQTIEVAPGKYETQRVACAQVVRLNELVSRRGSNGVLLGDFGRSWIISRDQPVSTLLNSRIEKTLQLTVWSTVLALLIALPLGVYSAVRQYSRFDYVATTLAFLGSSMPSFFFGIGFILLFSILPKGAGWFYLPPGSAAAVRAYDVPGLGTVQPGTGLDQLLHGILPIAVLTLVSVAGFSRFVRGSMLEVLRQDYVRTARAKGLREVLVISRHALRNALIPFITIFAFALPGLFAGAIITESIFSWQGMGRLFLLALNASDYPVAMAMLFITAVLTVIATLLSDVAYTLVDPRIKLS